MKEPTPLKAIDFCYHDEDEMVTVLDCITLCVMVVSYSAENARGYQMLIILEAILPCYMQQIQSPSYIQSESKTEREIILQLAVAVRTMVHNSEGLAKCVHQIQLLQQISSISSVVINRSYNGPYRNSPEHKGSSQRNCSRGPPCSPGLDFEDESHSKYVSDMGRTKNYDTPEDSEVSLVLCPTLCVVVHFAHRQLSIIPDDSNEFSSRTRRAAVGGRGIHEPGIDTADGAGQEAIDGCEEH